MPSFVLFSAPGMDGRSFEDLPITAKQIIIDSLSFPMSVVEVRKACIYMANEGCERSFHSQTCLEVTNRLKACRLHDYHWLQPHVKAARASQEPRRQVHILNAYGSAMADLHKYEAPWRPIEDQKKVRGASFLSLLKLWVWLFNDVCCHVLRLRSGFIVGPT